MYVYIADSGYNRATLLVLSLPFYPLYAVNLSTPPALWIAFLNCPAVLWSLFSCRSLLIAWMSIPCFCTSFDRVSLSPFEANRGSLSAFSRWLASSRSVARERRADVSPLDVN